MNTQSGSQNASRPLGNMSNFGSQPNPRQTTRLQNSQKTGLGNGNAGAGWAFGAPSTLGGLGGAPGLNQARPGQLTGFAQVMGGGSGQSPVDFRDTRDFPTLGGPGPSQNNPTIGGWNSSAIRQSSTQQPQQAGQAATQQQPRAPSTAPSHQSLDQFDGQRTQQPSAERNGGGEDFPPLSGQPNGDTLGQNNGFGASLVGSPDGSQSQLSGQQTQLPIRDASNGFSQPQQPPIGSGQTQTQETQSNQQASAAPAVKGWADMTEHERFGMSGLAAKLNTKLSLDLGQPIDDTLPVMELSAAMLLGQDLDTTGMNLDSPEPIYPTFSVFPNRDGGSGSIFDIKDRQPIPAFQLSDSYQVNNVPPLSTRMASLSDDTLLWIFYQSPKSVEQELAAQELTGRGWCWHKTLHQWLQKDTREANQGSMTLIDHTNGALIGAPPVRIDDRIERGVYIFFDVQNWRRERREFTLDYKALDERSPALPNAHGALAVGQNGPAIAPAFGVVNDHSGLEALWAGSGLPAWSDNGPASAGFHHVRSGVDPASGAGVGFGSGSRQGSGGGGRQNSGSHAT